MKRARSRRKSALAARRGGETSLAAALTTIRTLLAQADSKDISAAATARLGELAAQFQQRYGPPPSAAAMPLLDRTARIYFDYALTGILETDRNGEVRRANPAAASITGHDRKQLDGTLLTQLAAVASAADVQRHLALLHEQGISQAEWTLRRIDGREILVEIASVQVDEDHFIHFFDDVTSQRQAAAEIERARAAAEAANLAKSQFLANISHEIRTPLNGIIGLSQLALFDARDGPLADHLGNIQRSGKNLLRIINDLLDAAKLEAGRMEFELAPFSPDDLLADLASLRAQIPAGKALELGFHVAQEVPHLLLGDRLRLGQCLTNLLGNAIKFTPAGRVDLRIDVAGDRVRAADGETCSDAGGAESGASGGALRAPMLRLVVSDTGIGIAPEALDRLFSAFSQADASTARRFGGTGLGLHITREMARGMGGDLQVDSRPGSGSRFTLTIPLHIAATAPATQAATQAHEAADVPQEFRGRRILVAEDDRVNQIVILNWLARAGIETTLARDGHEALALFDTLPAPPDLVLMDVQMPGMDGLEAARRLRARGVGLPVVGLSAGASRAEQDACSAAGMHDFLAKPIDVDELWGCLTRWLPPMAEDAAGDGSGNTPEDTVEDTVERRFLNDREILARARALFLESHGADGARLQSLLMADDIAAMAGLAHGLKGAAATLGLDALATLARDLEHALGGASPNADAAALIGRIDAALAGVAAEFAG